MGDQRESLASRVVRQEDVCYFGAESLLQSMESVSEMRFALRPRVMLHHPPLDPDVNPHPLPLPLTHRLSIVVHDCVLINNEGKKYVWQLDQKWDHGKYEQDCR